MTGRWQCAQCPARGTVTGWPADQLRTLAERALIRHYNTHHREKEQTTA